MLCRTAAVTDRGGGRTMSSNESTQDVTPGPDHDRRRLLAQIGVGGAIVWADSAISGTALAQGTPSG